VNPFDARPPTVDADLVRGPLRILYREIDAEIARLAPVCVLSGRCCRFREHDHTLFITSAEAAVLIADAPAPTRPLDHGATCPWQDDAGRCTAREARPVGCRVYFCDPGHEDDAARLSAEALARIETLGSPRGYAPMHRHLEAAAADGRLADAGPRA